MAGVLLTTFKRERGGTIVEEQNFVNIFTHLKWVKCTRSGTVLAKEELKFITDVECLDDHQLSIKFASEQWIVECQDEHSASVVMEMCRAKGSQKKAEETQSAVSSSSSSGDRFGLSGSSPFSGYWDRFGTPASQSRSDQQRAKKRGLHGDDFGSASRASTLAKVGNPSKGPSPSESTSGQRTREAAHFSSSLRAESLKTSAARTLVREDAGTPERSPLQAERALAMSPPGADVHFSNASSHNEDSGEAKRARIDQLAGTLDRTPEKVSAFSGTRPPLRVKRPDVGGTLPLYGIKAIAPQSSASYGGYRSSFNFGGLRNLGNTCYLNAVMQAVCSLREFVYDLRAMAMTMPPCTQGELYRCTVDILQQMSSSSALQGPLSPAKLREHIGLACPMFRSSAQQDAHEFFLEYINQLHDELLGARKVLLDTQSETTEDSAVLATQQHLDSEVHKQLVCVACGEPRDVSERFRDFSLDFSGNSTSTTGDRCSLRNMLAAYFSSENLEAKCERCGAARAQMEKKLSSPPRVLVCHLKRFVPNFEKQCYEKQHQIVEIPMRFDLDPRIRGSLPAASDQAAPGGSSPTTGTVRLPARPLARTLSQEADDAMLPEPEVSSTAAASGPASSRVAPAPEMHEATGALAGPATPLTYSLRSVVAHDGASPHSGHYVCYARSETGAWRLYDDSLVSELGEGRDLEREFGRKAYILFYVLQQP